MQRRKDFEDMVGAGESLSDTAEPNVMAAWIYGVIFALPFIIYGIYCIHTRTAKFLTRNVLDIIQLHFTPLVGRNAVAIGVSYLGVGCFLHFHYFWTWRERFQGYGQIGKVLSMLCVAGGIVYYVFNCLVLE
jgi:hypothetical protein